MKQRKRQRITTTWKKQKKIRSGEVVEIYDWRNETSKYIKPPGQWYFAFSKMMRIILTKSSKGTVLIRGELVYNSDSGVGKPVTKKTKSIKNIKPTQILKQNVVNNNKKVDVNNLLVHHFGDEWKNDTRLSFYKFVVEEDTVTENETVEDETTLCENIEEELELSI
ncbi:unnamed protein product [Psylliodes chrysocephalus]|uniref:Uncharacterized protein n=1 Tax=Psylliodes chrysocephalus TaxID=3402493 RepID=A0A9P0DA94_9CUCU|nr:unnamed protein product [Psylliodes chrysocephala]